MIQMTDRQSAVIAFVTRTFATREDEESGTFTDGNPDAWLAGALAGAVAQCNGSAEMGEALAQQWMEAKVARHAAAYDLAQSK